MSNLERRLRKLETPYGGKCAGLVIARSLEDGRVISRQTMQVHENAEGLLKCLGKNPDTTLTILCQFFGSAEELFNIWRAEEVGAWAI